LSDYACICKDGYKPSLKKFMQQFRSTVRFKGSNIATKALVIKEFKKKMTDMGLDAVSYSCFANDLISYLLR
jgi:hypothetical protein